MTTPIIRKLDEAVINRIAAGEVVQKPAAAIKEMMENSIDAGATQVTVTVKAGGLALVQIQDNGHGIRKEDLPIVCERFTTSKLKSFEDLRTIATYGFRGEALASISFVANVTILTKTADSACAYKAKYLDGKLIPLKPGDKCEAKPCAGVNGTIITVEDMFYNMPTRKQAFKNPSEQYQKILEAITKFSIHFAGRNVSFTCKKFGQNIPDLHTPNNSSISDNIRIAYGAALAKELLDVNIESNGEEVDESNEQETNRDFGAKSFTIRGKISNANYSNKKSIFILFINDRLVESSAIKKTVESVYNDVLPKHSFPFVYLSIKLPPQQVDVNVHPTKKEVHFLYEDELLSALFRGVREVLGNCNESRMFATQTLITSHIDPIDYSEKAASPRVSMKSSLVENMTTSKSTPVQLKSFSMVDDIGSAQKEFDDDEDDVRPVQSRKKFTNEDENLHIEAQRKVVSQNHSSKQVYMEADEVDDDEEIEEEVDEEGEEEEEVYSKGEVQPAPKTNKFNRGHSLGVESTSMEFEEIEEMSSTEEDNNVEATPTSARKRGNFTRDADMEARSSKSKTSSKAKSSLPPNKLIRTDPTLTRIDSFFAPKAASKPGNKDSTAVDATLDMEIGDDEMDVDIQNEDDEICICPESNSGVLPFSGMKCICCARKFVDLSKKTPRENEGDVQIKSRIVFPRLEETNCEYESIQTLLSDIKRGISSELESIVKSNTFVGVVDSRRVLIQHKTKLLLIDIRSFCRALFYQMSIRKFSFQDKIQLKKPVNIQAYIMSALNDTSVSWDSTLGSKESFCESTVALLLEKSEMLDEYFGITIDVNSAQLTSMPLLIPGYCPSPMGLPIFLLRLATETNWEDELPCFRDVANELSRYYSTIVDLDLSDNPSTLTEISSTIQDVLLPAMKAYLIPSSRLVDCGAVVSITTLEDLYKIFERC